MDMIPRLPQREIRSLILEYSRPFSRTRTSGTETPFDSRRIRELSFTIREEIFFFLFSLRGRKINREG